MRRLLLSLTVVGIALSPVTALAQGAPDPAPILKFLRVNEQFCTAGQPRPEQFAQLKADGIKTVLNLRPPTEYRADDEVQAVSAAGLKYFNIPVVYTAPTHAQADEFLRITDDPANRPMLIHCAAAVRAGARRATRLSQAGPGRGCTSPDRSPRSRGPRPRS